MMTNRQAEVWRGQVMDVVSGTHYPGEIEIKGGAIAAIRRLEGDPSLESGPYFAPGLVDAHVHIESSLLAPTAFARAAVLGGVLGCVCDPHEIANVLGVEGVKWMVENGERSPFYFHFGAPSCVPATPFETSGASFDEDTIADLLDSDGVHYLAEVMNFPAVIAREPRMMGIIEQARKRNKRIDGHAPGVGGEDIRRYAEAGVETDHECFTLEQGRDRILSGMQLAIREGSAARNFEALWPLLKEYPEQCFLCTDDMHPDDLVRGYLNQLLARGVQKGISAISLLRAATLNPIRHYQLPMGLLQEGDPADMVCFEDLEHFRVRHAWIRGEQVVKEGRPLLDAQSIHPENRFGADPVSVEALQSKPLQKTDSFPIIVAHDGELYTDRIDEPAPVEDHAIAASPDRDLLKLCVVNRYNKAPPAIGLVRGFGLKSGALAGSVAHDSHNIVSVAADDRALCQAINRVIELQGGLVYADRNTVESLPLPLAGLMSDRDPWTVAAEFERLTTLAKDDGCQMRSPYMTLSFLALLVIPKLKMSDLGLFDGERFEFVYHVH